MKPISVGCFDLFFPQICSLIQIKNQGQSCI